jgi:Rad3-related DNA helicase/serine/threonine protein kinase
MAEARGASTQVPLKNYFWQRDVMAEVELQQIGPYQVTRLLRTSPTSNFYQGKQRKKTILIQRLNIPLTTPEDKERFLFRAKQLKKLKHRNIVNLLDANFDGDNGYLVMEYHASETLSQHFTPDTCIAPDEAKRYLSPIAGALHYAHMNNIVHANLHPDNLLVRNHNDILLTNFSLTLPHSTPSLDDEVFAIPYMAPEHLRGQPIAASDQYSLAVIIYELLCGRRPYTATEQDFLLMQQEQIPLLPPSSLNEAISPAVEHVIMQALALDPAERFPHIQAFADHYLSALLGFSIKSTEARTPRSTPIATSRQLQTSHQHTDVLPASAHDHVATSKPREEEEINQYSSDTDQPVTSISMLRKTANLSQKERYICESKEILSSPANSLQVKEPASTSNAQLEESSSDPTVLAEEYDPDLLSDDLFLTDQKLSSMVTADLWQGGILSQRLSGYEERPAQVEMAALVSQAITQHVPAIIEAATGTGKALDVDTPIPTPSGWKRMGDLIIGDFVFDETGHPTQVTAAFDVMYDRKCYEVIFSDGSSLIADAEHEWVSYTCADRRRAGQTRSDTYMAKNFVTADRLVILDQLIALSTNEDSLSVDGAVALIGGHRWSIYQAACKTKSINSGKRPICYPRLDLLTSVRSRLARDLDEQRRDGRAYTLVTTEQMAATLTIGSPPRANHAIAVPSALTLPEVELPIDPYFLGVWLGDGYSRNNQIKTADPDLIPEIEKAGYTVRSLRSHPYLYAVDDEHGKAANRWQPCMTGRLRALRILQNKHIPMIYLRASEQQRRALLAGLLDTDGTVNRCGAVEFTTTSPQLAQDTHELICSLGFRPTLREGRAKLRGRDCGPKWTIAFTTDQQIFRLKRKVAAHKERLRNYSSERNRFRYVVKVREVPSRPVRCIQVASASHLYLAGRSMIPTHNSLAYLVPAVRSGQVAIISTANKALQEQLFYKDIPFVQKHIKAFDAALVKGVNNYVCLDRVEKERTGLQFYIKNPQFLRLLDVLKAPPAGFNGDFETLDFQLPSDIRSKVATDSDECSWSKCDYFPDCYVRRMRERAQRAKVIVVNHTLLLLDAVSGGHVLPDRDVIIIDEAHHLEEEATRCFTITVSPTQIQTLLAQRMLRDHSQPSLQNEVMHTAQETWTRLQQIADPIHKSRTNLESPLEEGLHLASLLDDLANSLRKQRPTNLEEKESQLYDKLISRTQNLATNIRTVFSVSDRSKFVYYVERVEGSVNRGFIMQASAAPLDVTSFLKERLFNKCAIICTSATLATTGPNPVHPEDKGPNFAYFRRRVGLDPLERSDVLEHILPLTFDYERNALLYLPRDLPAPTFGTGSDDYMKAIAREMYKLVKLSRGRAFLLFSSKRMLDRAYELMSPHLPYPLLKQGDMTRLELTQRFRQEEGAVLFGLKSFWEGVDIAGDALSLVVIDKLPFDPPDDPVHEARVAQMKEAGENWFGTYVLPQAVLRLKQGIGRLLRTRQDHGVMAILDTRLHTKGYGKLVLDALPPARRTSSLRDVERFFA